tara:strand:- start:5221 stop:5961 length:741 start_codon:yes stop_codon:yes gene_type:complete
MKNYYFLSGLPRAGNTLLGYLLNKHKDIALTSNSLLPDILFSLYKIKHQEIFLNFPDEKSFSGIYNNVFKNYFKNWKENKIISRGPWGTKGNLILLKPLIKKPKFIILHRPLEECLNSFVTVNKIKNKDIEKYADDLLSPYGILGRTLQSTQNIIATNQDHIVIFYKDLVTHTEREMKKIYKYLDLKYKKFNFNVEGEFETNGVQYNDDMYDSPIHKLERGKPREFKTKNKLPKALLQRCREEDVL